MLFMPLVKLVTTSNHCKVFIASLIEWSVIYRVIKILNLHYSFVGPVYISSHTTLYFLIFLLFFWLVEALDE